MSPLKDKEDVTLFNGKKIMHKNKSVYFYARQSIISEKGGLPDPIAIWKCWNENIGGRNALNLLYLKTSLWSSHF